MDYRHRQRASGIAFVLTLILILSMASPALPPGSAWAEPRLTGLHAKPVGSDLLYRARIQVSTPARWQSLSDLGVIILEEGPGWAAVLADFDQMETLARLRFSPRAAEALTTLVVAHLQDKPWLGESLASWLTAIDALQEQAVILGRERRQVLPELRQVVKGLTSEQLAGIASLAALDDDGDGLTNTEEQWWCTNPSNADSDGDLVLDGTEIAQLLNGDTTNGKPFLGWPPNHPDCYDDDSDSIPDMAEVHVIGLNINRESTDGDKFDDGQEFFGITKYPDYGALPRPEDTFITANLPGWVDPPGNSPFVAAYPQIVISVIPDSIEVELVTQVTAGQSHSAGETIARGTIHAEGSSTGVGKEESHTYSQWQELGNSIADAVERTTYQSVMQSCSQQYTWEHSVGTATECEYGGNSSASLGAHTNASIGAEVSAEVTVGFPAHADASVGASVSTEVESGISSEYTQGESWAARNSTTEQTTQGGSVGYEVSYESGQSVAVSQIHERSQTTGQGYETAQATTITREDYEEFAFTTETTMATGQEWSTATAFDSSHTADLTFAYRISNLGSDNARRIENILFAITIGRTDSPAVTTYAGNLLGDSCSQATIQNLYPGDVWPAQAPAVQCAVPLSLEMLKAIDLGAPVRVVVADYSYGDDEQFYENAWGGGVIVEVDDGTWDGDESVDNYLIPTWGTETYQDVLRRYFPVAETDEGDLRTLWTPEYDNNHEITGWYEHEVSDRSWWNIYLSEYGDGTVMRFRERVATPESHVLLRFNRDTDVDHYSDRVERRLETDPQNPVDHPNAGLIAGYYEQRSGDTVQVQIALMNHDNYEAYGVQSTMYAADDTITVGQDIVGMAGLIRPGETVRLTSRILTPQPVDWSGVGQPVVSGHYVGAMDQVYTFVVAGVITSTGFVGQTPGLHLNWTSSTGASGTLDVGASYDSPSPLPVADGVEIGMLSGSLYQGDEFTVEAIVPRDVFTYTINEEPYTPPIIIVSYNDPEGNNRLVTHVQLEHVNDDLAPYVDQMQPAPKLQVLSQSTFDPSVDNLVTISFINPEPTPIVDGHLMIVYATYSGTVVLPRLITTTFASGPNVYNEVWNTSEFSPTWQPDTLYKIKVFATDADGRPLDIATKHFFEMGRDQEPQIALETTTVDLGHIPQGQLLQHDVAVANIGLTDLWISTDVGAPIPLRPEATLIQLPPAGLDHIDLALDSAEFTPGPFVETVNLLTNDPGQPSLTITVIGTVDPLSGEAAAYSIDPFQPWDETVYVPGPQPANQVLTFSSTLPLFVETEPLYLRGDSGQVVGLGQYGLEAGTLVGGPAGDGTVGNIITPSLAPLDVGDDLALPFEEWMAVASSWKTTDLGGAVVRFPPSWQTEALPEGWAGFASTDGGHTIRVTTQSGAAQADAEPPDLASYRELGYTVRKSSVNGLPAWDVLPPLSVDEFCRQVVVGVPERWIRFQFQSNACSEDGEFRIVVSSLQIQGGEAYPEVEPLNWENIIPDAINYNGQGAYDYCSQYWNCNCNSDGVWYSGDGGHFIAHAICNGGFPIHWCIGQDHVAAVTNITTQRTFLHNTGHVSSVSCSSLQVGDVVYIGTPGCWGWGGVVISMDHSTPHLATHTANLWNVHYNGLYSSCGDQNVVYDCVHINRVVPPSTPALYDISNPEQDGAFSVDWSSVSGADSYTLQEKHNGGGWSSIYTGSSTHRDISGHAAGQWCYQVQACNAGGCSGWSSTKCANVKPATPTLYDISNPEFDGGYSIDWSDVAGADTYTLQENLNGGGWSTIYTGATSYLAISGRSPGTWCYQVLATTYGINGSWSSPKCTLSNNTPYPPTNLTPPSGAGQMGRQVTLAWSDGGDPDNAPNPYRQFEVEIGTPDGGWSQNLSWTEETNWTVVVPDDGRYRWRGRAYDGANASSWTALQDLDVYSIAKGTSPQMQMALPQPVESHARYGVQHGDRASFTSAPATRVLSVQLPNRSYDQATLDVLLLSANGGTLTFSVDVGDDGQDIWSYTLVWDGPALVHSPNLAAALNRYLANQPVPIGAPVTVPIAVNVEIPCELFLSNMELQAVAAADAGLSPGSVTVSDTTPTEGEIVTIQAVVANNAALTLTNVVAAFYVGDPAAGGTYLGANLLPRISAGATALASLPWDTTALTGSVEIYLLLDPTGQVEESDEGNNQASTAVTILTRPDLAVTAIVPSDNEPVVGEQVTVAVAIHNHGQTDAGAAVYALYEGDPSTGGVLIGEESATLSSGSDATLEFAWVPGAPGPVHLSALADRDDAVSEYDEANNSASRDLYAGLAGPILLDSGGSYDPPYTPDLGYGAVDEGLPDATVSCGVDSSPEETMRRDPGGQIIYRFDHLLPSHYYHLDIVLYECDGAGRQESIFVDGNIVAGPVDIGDAQVHRLSLRLDPAFYADHAITVTIEAPGIDGAVVSHVSLHDIQYRYADAGGSPDPQYGGSWDYGWMDGTANTNWGTLPYQSVRVDQEDAELRYRFDGLQPDKNYQVHLTFWQPSGVACIQQVWIDDQDTGLVVNTGDYVLHLETVAVPPSAYLGDGSIVVRIVRIDAGYGARVNEIALEEETLSMLAQPNIGVSPSWIDASLAEGGSGQQALLVQNSGSSDLVYAVTYSPSAWLEVTPTGGTVPAGQSASLAVNLDAGSLVSGTYTGTVTIAHNAPGDPLVIPVRLYVSGSTATTAAIPLVPGWNLVSFPLAPVITSTDIVLSSIAGHYDLVYAYDGCDGADPWKKYDPNAPPFANDLGALDETDGFWIHMLVTDTLVITGTETMSSAIPLCTGWNMVGYPLLQSLPVTTALASIDGDYLIVFAYAAADPDDPWKKYDPSAPPFANDLDLMQSGWGYWISVSRNCTWILDN